MSDDELSAIEQRAQAATPGPWEVIPDIRPDVVTDYMIFNRKRQGGYAESGHVGTVWGGRPWVSLIDMLHRMVDRYVPDEKAQRTFRNELRAIREHVIEQTKQYKQADADFIANAITDIPRLLAYVRTLQARIAELEQEREP